jgi:hypothetical protein
MNNKPELFRFVLVTVFGSIPPHSIPDSLPAELSTMIAHPNYQSLAVDNRVQLFIFYKQCVTNCFLTPLEAPIHSEEYKREG